MGMVSRDKMADSARRYWREFSAGRPGRRFQDRYHRRQKEGRGRLIVRIFNIFFGLVLIALSAIGGLLPVLGWGTAIIGFGLVAGEVLFAALLLDKVEKWLWRFVQFCKDVWLLANFVGKALITLLLAALAAGLLYGMYSAVMSLF